MCGGPVGDIVDLGGDIISGAGDLVGGALDTVGNVVEGALDDPLKTAAMVAVAAMAPEALGAMGLGDAAAASEFMAADAAGLAAQGLSQEQIAATLAESYGIDSAAASSIAGATSAGSYGEAAAQYGSTAEPGFTTQVFDDGSQLITDSTTGQVIGGTDTAGSTFTTEGGLGTYTDTGAPLGGTPETNFGGGLASPTDTQALLDYNAANAGGSSYTPSPSTVSNALKSVLGGGTALGGLTNLGGTSGTSGDTSGIRNLTPGLTHAETNFELTGEPVVHASAGGGMGSYFNSGLSSSDSNDYNYLDAANAKLKPGLLKPNLNFSLSGMPQGHAGGGSIEGHNPEFYSEGGLQHRYVKGEGDGTSDSVPAMLASGEFVIPADVVSGLGNGDNDAGAQVLDEFLSVIRQHKREADPKDLPEDSKGPLTYLAEAKKKVSV